MKITEKNKCGSRTNRLLSIESRLFRKEYQKYFNENETKPESTGMPYFLRSPISDTGVLLVHGLMAAPEEVREWADFLYEKGLTVYAPRLAGHGTSSVDLSTRRYNEWIASVDRGHEILKTCCSRIMIAGFSTGAGLALQSVIMKPDDFEALIAVSAPLKFKSFSSNFAELLNWFNNFCHFLGVDRLARKFVKNHADNPHINYLRCPVSAIVQVKKLMKKVHGSLSKISIPTLVIQAKNDPKVAPESGSAIFDGIHTDKKHYAGIDFDMHGIVRGEIALEVFREIEFFLSDYQLIPEIQ